MQTLRHDDNLIDYSPMIQELEEKYKLKLVGIDVEVKEHPADDPPSIELIIGENSLMLSLMQCRDLVRELNISINKISKKYRKSKYKE